jgi:hypothetical protein
MVQKGPGLLSDQVCAELKKAACELYLKKRENMHMRGGLCEGVIQTEWETCVVAACRGIIFRTQFDWDGGGCKVNFLLREEDLERGAEVIREMMEQVGSDKWATSPEPFPVPELYEFYDLRPRLH